MRTATTTRAIGYCRISDDTAGDAKGVQRQEEDVRALAERNGFHLVDVVVDNDRGASRYSRRARPGWAEVVERARAGEVSVVVAYDLDRITRRVRDLELLAELARKGVTFHTVTAGLFDLTDASCEMMATMLLATKQYEVEMLRTRLMRQQEQTRREGRRHNGRRRLYGYTMAMDPVPDEVPWVRRAVEMVAEGISCNAVAKMLNAEGSATTAGGPWRSGAVKNLVTNPALVGQVAYQGRAVGPAAWPAIVDESTWHAAQEALRHWAQGSRPRRSSSPWSGLLVCGECGSTLVRSKAGSDVVWACRAAEGSERCGRVAITSRVEDWLLRQIDNAVGEIELRRRVEGQTVRPVTEIQADVAALLDVRLLLSPDEYQRRLDHLETELHAAQAAEAGPGPISRLMAHPGRLHEVWEELPDLVQHQILTMLVQRVTVRRAGRRAWNDDIATERCSISWTW